MDRRIRNFINYAELRGLSEPLGYQEAVDLGRLTEWWRNCALRLFELRTLHTVAAETKLISEATQLKMRIGEVT